MLKQRLLPLTIEIVFKLQEQTIKLVYHYSDDILRYSKIFTPNIFEQKFPVTTITGNQSFIITLLK